MVYINEKILVLWLEEVINTFVLCVLKPMSHPVVIRWECQLNGLPLLDSKTMIASYD